MVSHDVGHLNHEVVRPVAPPKQRLSLGHVRTMASVAIATVFISVSFMYKFGTPSDSGTDPVKTAQSQSLGTKSNAFYFQTSPTEPISDPNPDAPSPRIAWLMSFPNSGTTYTALLIRDATQSTTATNYGDEGKIMDGRVHPVHESSQNGPFLKDPTMSKPQNYILTKTHCGGRCLFCGPKGYIETTRSFHLWCRTAKKVTGDDKTKLDFVQYDSSLVQRAVHLVRDPFDNIVARLHYARNRRGKEFAKKYPDTPKGLHALCKALDDGYAKDDSASRFLDEELLKLMKKAPCHGEFYKYVQWHNLASEVTQDLSVPTLIVHYEDYTNNFEVTASGLLQFLELEKVAEPPKFITGKHYANYFSKEEHEAISALVRELATPETWATIKHYF